MSPSSGNCSWKSVLSVGYVGRRGLHLQRESDINQPTIATVAGKSWRQHQRSTALSRLRLHSPDRQRRQFALQLAAGSLEPPLHWRVCSFGVSYTLSKSMTMAPTSATSFPNTYDTRNLWGHPSSMRATCLSSTTSTICPSSTDKSSLDRQSCSADGRSAASPNSRPACRAASPAANDYAGVGLDSNFGCGVNGQFWNVNGDPKIIGTFGPKRPMVRYHQSRRFANLYNAHAWHVQHPARPQSHLSTRLSRTGTSASSRHSPSTNGSASSSAPKPSTSSTTRTGAAAAAAAVRRTSASTRQPGHLWQGPDEGRRRRRRRAQPPAVAPLLLLTSPALRKM